MAKASARTKANPRNLTAGSYRDILYEVKDQVAWVTINRPRVLNAFREQSLDEMIDALKSTRDDPSIACAVVTGAGDKSFSTGGDFYAMKRLNWTNAAMWNDRMQGLAMTIRGLPIPVIAMINGWCMGGGHELALWCDLAIASENAVLGQTGAKVGACPTVGATQYLPRIIGERLAREMIFCARRFTAREAVEIGQERGAVVPGAGMVWRNRDGAVEIGQRVVVAAHQLQDRTTIGEGIGEVGLRLDGCQIALFGRRKLAGLALGIATGIKKIGAARTRRQRLVVALLRQREVAQLHQQFAMAGQGGGIAGFERQRPFDQGAGLARAALLSAQHPHQMAGIEALGVKTQYLLIQLFS